MAPPLTRGGALVRRRLSGLAFLAVIFGLIALTIGAYQKVFTPVVEVALEADRVGNQLSAGADVKARGLIVGEVRAIESTETGARLELAIDRDQVELLPSDARAQLLPKTLFGEKFVSLVIDSDSAARPLRDGDVIPQDRSQTARETSTALDNLLPLLQTLNPQAVSTTLNAVSSALRGRGERLGSNLVLFRDYLEEFNPELPTLEQNFIGVADFADNLDAAAPDFLQLFDNSAFLGRSLVETEGSLESFLRDTSAVSGTFESFLAENEDRFIRLPADSLPSLEVYERYSPEFPCLADGLARSASSIADTFGVRQPGLHITLEFTEDLGPYVPGDEPEYLDDDGPTCFGLEGEPIRPFPVYRDGKDGYRDDQEVNPETGRSQGEPPTGSDGEDDTYGDDGARTRASGLPFSPASFDRAAVDAVVAPVMGVAQDDVPDVAVLLFGPVVRGIEVRLS